jgi:rhodanese-related sulfurtransferase
MMIIRPTRAAALVTAIVGLLVGGCSGTSSFSPPPAVEAQVSNIDGPELQAMMEDGRPLVILEVRSAAEYEDGHITGATNVPLTNPTDAFEAAVAQLDRRTRTVCVCAGGFRSAQAADLLIEAGFTAVYNLEGGLRGWDGPWTPECPDCGV